MDRTRVAELKKESIDSLRSSTSSSDRRSVISSTDSEAATPIITPLMCMSTSSLSSHIYTNTVNQPDYYAQQKSRTHRTTKNAFRKFAGVPFAVVYGVLLYWIVDSTLLSELQSIDNNQLKSVNGITIKTCPFFSKDNKDRISNGNTSYLQGVLDISANKSEKDDYLKQNNISTRSTIKQQEDESTSEIKYIRGKVLYAVCGFISLIAIISMFSRSTRCVMFLILPGMITRHSRTLIFTIIMGYLIKYPMHTMQLNMDEIFNNAHCLYQSVVAVVCVNLLQIKTLFHFFSEILQSLRQASDTVNKVLEALPVTVSMRIDVNTNITQVDLSDVFHISRMPDFMEQLLKEINKLLNWSSYIEVIRKSLIVISIVLLICDAVRYLQHYYTDSSFDNQFVGRSMREFWRKKKMKSLTPLRHWEVNKGFKEWKTRKCIISTWELYSSLGNCFPTFILFAICCVVILVDMLLVEAIENVKRYDQFNVTFFGLQQHYSKSIRLNLPGFNLTSQNCQINVHKTDKSEYWTILLLLIASLTSCVLEVCLSRVRASMCDIFYPDKAEERADYVHYRLKAGRISRKTKLLLLIRRELDRRKNMELFSPVKRLTVYFEPLCMLRRTFRCPGCKWRVSRSNGVMIRFSNFEQDIDKIMCRLCEDCYIDFPEDPKSFM